MAEWSNAAVLKTVVGVSPPRVRISAPPYKVLEASQILAEFIHVVTDARRFSAPLELEQAIQRAEIWWNATEVIQVFPTAESTLLFLNWLNEHRLGRKRLLDTMLASTFLAGEVTSMLTLNRDDFEIFGNFSFPR